MLRLGGNAVDAAVATGFALAVTLPQAGNIGGGGFMLVSLPNRPVEFLDFRETAPSNLTASLLRPSGATMPPGSSLPPMSAERPVPRTASVAPSVFGALSVGVPGTVAGFAEALAKYGTWSFDRVVALAVDLAERGVWLTTRQALYFEMYYPRLSMFASTRDCFFPGGERPLPGTLFRQPDLARTLRALAESGPDAFYRGRIGRLLVDQLAREQGVITREDLDNYRPVWRVPLRRQFAGREVYAPALPSGGGLVLQTALGLLDAAGVRQTAPGTASRAALLARVFRLAFAFRATSVGDPDGLSAEALAAAAAFCERSYRASDLDALEKELLPLRPSLIPQASSGNAPNTTHYSVLDSEGGAASVTYSLNTTFGSKLVVHGAGFLLNNSIDDFAIEGPNWYGMATERRNALVPGRRPASSMTPCIVKNGDKVECVLGASGGPRIPTAVAQCIVSMLVDGASPQDGVRLARIHHQMLPDTLVVEDKMPAAVIDDLRRTGHEVELAPALGLGVVVTRDAETDDISAVLDPRPILTTETLE